MPSTTSSSRSWRTNDDDVGDAAAGGAGAGRPARDAARARAPTRGRRSREGNAQSASHARVATRRVGAAAFAAGHRGNARGAVARRERLHRGLGFRGSRARDNRRRRDGERHDAAGEHPRQARLRPADGNLGRRQGVWGLETGTGVHPEVDGRGRVDRAGRPAVHGQGGRVQAPHHLQGEGV